MSKGLDTFATVNHFINENVAWLISQLHITSLLSDSDNSSVSASLTQYLPSQLSQDPARPPEDFNPLKTFVRAQLNHVGTTSLLIALVCLA